VVPVKHWKTTSILWLAKLDTTTRMKSTKNVINSHLCKLVAFNYYFAFLYVALTSLWCFIFHLKCTLVHLAAAMELGHSNDLYL
jgi:hypothetical protein